MSARRIRLWELVAIGAGSLWRYKLRSFLTMLGIIFGIAAVMTMLGVGAGAEHEILAQMEKLGLRNIILNTVRPPEEVGKDAQRSRVAEYGLNFLDMDRIRESCADVEMLLPVRDIEREIWWRGTQVDGRAFGVKPAYGEVLNLDLASGRFVTDLDEEKAALVCVITRSVLDKIGYVGDPIGETFSIGGKPFEVVGVLESEEFQSASRKALASDSEALHVYVPYRTAIERYGTTSIRRKTGSFEATKVELHQIVVRARDESSVEPTARVVGRILERFHDKGDTEMVVPLDKLRQSQKAQEVFDLVMLLIAGISLLVGGIGIVNIMLATITERTREIGIRRALGATRAHVLLQFLVETTLLTTAGGILGCALGFAGVVSLRHFLGWDAVVTVPAIAASIAISCGVGILFGLYPARRAALMNPIAALRHE